ncbi:MAG: DUF4278 domain-containing protein [Synechococcaceae cyanobacterium SM2_3_60]|nr:DUF4278 domain-containing protein [Synechococcaceae cyanobacterium SM2_3_60]
MEAIYRGHEYDYQPTVAPATDKIVHAQYRGHKFDLRKLHKVNTNMSNFKLQYRGH